MKYHHIGIPTSTPQVGEEYNAASKFHAAGYFTSPFGIEWLRFDDDCELPDLIKTVPHVAFVVDDLALALEGRTVILPPSHPTDGVTVAFIVDNGAPVEFIEFQRPEPELWHTAAKIV